jgi:hypothetical protein
MYAHFKVVQSQITSLVADTTGSSMKQSFIVASGTAALAMTHSLPARLSKTTYKSNTLGHIRRAS